MFDYILLQTPYITILVFNGIETVELKKVISSK